MIHDHIDVAPSRQSLELYGIELRSVVELQITKKIIVLFYRTYQFTSPYDCFLIWFSHAENEKKSIISECYLHGQQKPKSFQGFR